MPQLCFDVLALASGDIDEDAPDSNPTTDTVHWLTGGACAAALLFIQCLVADGNAVQLTVCQVPRVITVLKLLCARTMRTGLCVDGAMREVSGTAPNSEDCASADLAADIVRGLASQVDLLGSGVSLAYSCGDGLL